MCRSDWGPLALHELRKMNVAGEQHKNSLCAHCVMRTPIIGARYRCLTCADYDLCQKCFRTTSVHAQHNFVKKESPSGSWKPAKRCVQRNNHRRQTNSSQQSVNLSLIAQLQSREITSNDYDLLLSLDNPGTSTNAVNSGRLNENQTTEVENVDLATYLVESLSCTTKSRMRELMAISSSRSSVTCAKCCKDIETSSPVRLPCRHIMHAECARNHFSLESISPLCPCCNATIFPGLRRTAKTKNKPTRKKSSKKGHKKTEDESSEESNGRKSGASELLGLSLAVDGLQIGAVVANEQRRPFTSSSSKMRQHGRIGVGKLRRSLSSDGKLVVGSIKSGGTSVANERTKKVRKPMKSLNKHNVNRIGSEEQDEISQARLRLKEKNKKLKSWEKLQKRRRLMQLESMRKTREARKREQQERRSKILEARSAQMEENVANTRRKQHIASVRKLVTNNNKILY